MRIEGTFLKSAIARRIFLMYCAAALAPTLLLSLLLYRFVDVGMRDASQREVVAASKGVALAVFERLDLASKVLGQLGARDDPAAAFAPGAAAPPFFTSLRMLAPDEDASGAGATLPTGFEPQLATRLRVDPAHPPGRVPAITLLHRIDTGGAGPGPELAGELDPGFLWGDREVYPVGLSTCVLGPQRERLFCSSEPLTDLDGEPVQASGTWDLFLRGSFGADAWSFVTTARERSVASDLPGLYSSLGWIWLGVLLLALLLSLVQLRRSMLPLDELVRQTRAIGREQYRSHDHARSDEFGVLATAFDEMDARVSRQMATLNAMSDLDRRILTRLDLPEIVDALLARLAQLAPEAVACVMYADLADENLVQVHTRDRGSTTTQRTTSGVRDSRAQPPAQVWEPVWPESSEEPDASLSAHGATHQLVCTHQGAGKGRIWIALGYRDPTPPAAELSNEVGELAGRIAVALAAKERDERLVYQARHDLLTGLPNRLAAEEALAEAIAAASSTGEDFAAMFLDIDRFKAINDGLGHLSGDRVLSSVARNLRTGALRNAFVARFGGDEFFAILRGISGPTQAAQAASRMADALAVPTLIDGIEFVISASIGIALYPRDGKDVEALMRCADLAMYRAKAEGGAAFAFFEQHMDREALERVQLESELRRALKDDAVRVHFQPKVDFRSGSIVGAEALARWDHPTRGMVPPLEFVALAEECGLIDTLGTTILDQACGAFARWKADGCSLRSISVNVSSRQLRSEGFVATVESMLRLHRLGPGELEIEITESMLVDDLETATRQLAAMRGLGVTIALDDFGTGYSSLTYLRTLPVDTLKIDRSFIDDIDRAESAGAMVKAIIALGEATGRTMVAEGVERQQQAELLGAWGCHYIQGFLLYSPMPPEELADLLAGSGGRSAVHE
jgi:diguanylate cyclase (GGDEF)-like protein